MDRLRLLIVDDEPGIRRFLDAALKKEHRVTAASSAAEALEILNRDSYHLVITDQRMPGMSGLDLLAEISGLYPDIRVMLLTAHGTVDEAVSAMKMGAADYLTKPLASPEEIRLKVRQVAKSITLQKKVSIYEETVPSSGEEDVIYRDARMAKVIELCKRVGPDDASVLITGESGTGKELLARLIHRVSHRRDTPFLVVNCAAFSGSLIESELFGHEKGSFTGAVALRPGKFEIADTGTIFLDEVGEIPLELQPKLLRVLQERTFERLGSNRTIHVDIRLLAATNRDLEADVREGRFREDLYFRLNVFPVYAPPLRERREDILLLANHFIRDACRRRGKSLIRLSPEAEALFLNYRWPGNVRELQNVVERLTILHENSDIRGEHLPPGMLQEGPTRKGTRLESLGKVEREHILAVLESCGGNRKDAAHVLEISLRTLQYRLKEYGVVP